MLSQQEYVERSLKWLTLADEGYNRMQGKQLGNAADYAALPTLAATIAQTYATLAITASLEAERTEDLAS